jgi:isoleucyl-tRNA synthetase
MVAKDGTKLSKSKGDTIEELFNDYGVDVLRWWVYSLAFENDIKVDREFFDDAGEAYRKIRNTIRFMLSNLADFTCTQEVSLPAPTSIDAWALNQFDLLSQSVVECYQSYQFRQGNQALYNFCNDTLSAVYLAAVKDRLYCDRPDSPRRRQTQATLFRITDGLCRLLAPVLCHTADEAYRALWKAGSDNTDTCVHLTEFIMSGNTPGFGCTADPAWTQVMAFRDAAQIKLDRAKSELGVENPLDAGLVTPDADGVLARFDSIDLADLLGISQVTIDASAPELKVIDLRSHPRCERSWKRDGTVRTRSDGGLLSDRDAIAIGVT